MVAVSKGGDNQTTLNSISAAEWLKRQMRIILILCVWSLGAFIVLLATVGWHLEHAFQTLLIGIAIMAFSLSMANRIWGDLS